MRLSASLLIVIISTGVLVMGKICPSSFFTGQPTSYTCSTGVRALSSSVVADQDQQYLTIQTDVRVTEFCSTTKDLILMQVTASDASELVSIRYNQDQKSFMILFFGTSKTIPVDTTSFTPLNTWFSLAFTVGVNYPTEDFSEAWASVFLPNAKGSVEVSAAQKTSVKFTNLNQISLCNDLTDQSGLKGGCDFKNLKYFPTYNYLGAKDYLDTTSLVGSYQFLEGVGFSAKTSAGSLPDITFGASTSTVPDRINSPSWINPAPGVSFTTVDQFMTLSSLTPLTTNPTRADQSFTINLWVKLPVATSDQTILKVISADKATTRLTLIFTSEAKIKATLGTGVLTSTDAIVGDTWTQVILPIDVYPKTANQACHFALYFGAASQGEFNDVCAEAFEDGDTLVVGGFVGSVQDLLLFTPSSMNVNADAMCSTNVALALGCNSPDASLLRVPSSHQFTVRSSPTVSYSCSEFCSSCDDDTFICRTCVPGYYFKGSTCTVCPAGYYTSSRSSTSCDLSCPENCPLCTDANTCQQCQPGYSLQNSGCVQCPAGKYAPTQTSPDCSESCPEGCATCTDGSTCQTCTSGFYLDGSTCKSCPDTCATCTDASTCQTCKSGFYLDGSTCASCPGGCTTCTDASTCQTCASTFYLDGSTCTSCPSGSYASSSTSTSCDLSCSESCTVCTDANTCQQCQPGYSLQNSGCVQCPAGKFAPSQNSPDCSESCPDECTTCTDASTCQTCASDYELVNNSCVKKSSSAWIIIVLVVIVILAGAAYLYKMRMRGKPTEASMNQNNLSNQSNTVELKSTFV